MWLNSNRLVKSQSSTLHIQLSSLLSSLQHTDAWVPQHHLLLLPIHGGSSSFAESPQSRCWMHHHRATPLPDASPRRWNAMLPSSCAELGYRQVRRSNGLALGARSPRGKRRAMVQKKGGGDARGGGGSKEAAEVNTGAGACAG